MNHRIRPPKKKSTIPESLVTIPVAESALAIIANLPEGCTATSKADAGRLVLDNVTLEKVFRGTIKKWSEITDDEDTLSGPGCNATSTIKPVVRSDRAGTTRILKKYLGLINSAWEPIAEGPENTTWPATVEVTRAAAPTVFQTSDPDASKVLETPGSIGYAALSSVRFSQFVPAEGGPGTQRFWVPIQRNGLSTENPKYSDPSTNGESATAANSNCTDTKYTNGLNPFPPRNVLEPWSEVTSATTQRKYPLCDLTYILAFQNYSAYSGATKESATTANNYINYIVNGKAKGGQDEIAGHDYLALPKGVLVEEAQKGATLIAF
jgi:ABC-type phosphate transport system substrate-binding protein